MHTRRSRSSTPLHGVCFLVALVVGSGRLGLSLVLLSLLPRQRPTPKPLSSSHPCDPFLLRTPRPALGDVLYDSSRSTRVTHTSSLSCPSRTIFTLVVQACFPSPSLRTRSKCSSPGARALIRNPSLTARQYPRCCMPLDVTPLSLRVRSALYALSVPRRIDAHTFRSPLFPSLLGLLQILSVALASR
ncbi:hypothetical protein B0H13DRAFT_2317749 [Mycena leptocephala]|nr:hypothetical protein B0H13DRAFT_2317749 [Mycena leptocephala]